MQIVRGLRNLPKVPERPLVTLGNFDGLHLGHREIFDRIIQRAKEIDGVSIVYTFDPHPLKILAPEQNLSLLTTFHKKMELIAAAGVDMVICADFNQAFARMHPRDFALKLKNGLRPESVYVGHDYSFGQRKAGTIDSLCRLGQELGFGVEVVEPVTVDGVRVSSSRIREYLCDGDVEAAAKLLGRYYSIEGKVVSGYQRGRAIGFPTANLDTPYEVIPAVGVFAVLACIGGDIWREGVVNVGYNPTFDRDDFIVEVHLLDTDTDIYGQQIEIHFISRIRDEVRFDSVDELTRQIALDIENARQTFAKVGGLAGSEDPR